MFNLVKNSKVGKNATWLISSKIAQSILGLIVGMLTARFLGPTNYGLINYAASITAFVIPIMNLGFTNIMVQELTNHSEEEGKILGSAIVMCTGSAFLCILGISIYTFLVDRNEVVTNVVVMLYSIMLIMQAFDIIQYWFQRKLLSKYTAIVSFAAYSLTLVYKVFLLISQKNVYWFAIANSVDYLLISIALLIIYHKQGGQKLQFDYSIIKRMFSSSKHYILSSLMVTIFAQTDRIMIKLMISETAVGYYSAAITCAALTQFVFAAVIDSFRPVIFEKKKIGDVEGFDKNLLRLNSIIIYLSIIQSILMTVFSPIIIGILYGNQYQDSILALQIVVWYTTFSYIGSVRNIWILSENKQKYLWILNLGGAFLNVLLNYLLIPSYGIYGASFASLVTQIFTNIAMNVIVFPLKKYNYYIFKSINPKYILDILRR